MSYSDEEISEMAGWIGSYAALTGDVKDPWQLGNFKKISEMMQQLQSDLEDQRRIASEWFQEQQKQYKRVEYLTGYLKGWKDQTKADFADVTELNNALVDALKRIEEMGTVESLPQTLIAIDALRRVTSPPAKSAGQTECPA